MVFSEQKIEISDLMAAWRRGMPMGGEMKPVERKCEATLSHDDYQCMESGVYIPTESTCYGTKSEERL
jgi:hypothetical protein